jgi:hypothetical protein
MKLAAEPHRKPSSVPARRLAAPSPVQHITSERRLVRPDESFPAILHKAPRVLSLQ